MQEIFHVFPKNHENMKFLENNPIQIFFELNHKVLIIVYILIAHEFGYILIIKYCDFVSILTVVPLVQGDLLTNFFFVIKKNSEKWN